MKNLKRHCNINFFLLIILIFVFIIYILFSPNLPNLSLDRERLFHIFLKIRLPEGLAALAVGLCLGFSGCIMQIILNNELASPFTLGLSAAASCGACISIIFFSSFMVGTFAIVFSIFSFGILFLLSNIVGGSRKNIVIVGICINFLFSSIRSILLSFSNSENVFQMAFWQLGSLGYAKTSQSLVLLIFFAISFMITMLFSRDLGLVLQGEIESKNYGVNDKLLRFILIFICSCLTALSVSLVGIISFVGLCSAHIARLIGGDEPKYLVSSSSIIGAIFLIFSAFLSKTLIKPIILPISSITSIFGILILFAIVAIKYSKRI